METLSWRRSRGDAEGIKYKLESRADVSRVLCWPSGAARTPTPLAQNEGRLDVSRQYFCHYTLPSSLTLCTSIATRVFTVWYRATRFDREWRNLATCVCLCGAVYHGAARRERIHGVARCCARGVRGGHFSRYSMETDSCAMAVAGATRNASRFHRVSMHRHSRVLLRIRASNLIRNA